MKTTNENNTATFIHLSSLSQYFFPLGSFIFPLLIWNTKKHESEFIDYNGKQVLNFQLSFFLYSLILVMIAIPMIIFSVFNNIAFSSMINEQEFILNQFKYENNMDSIIFVILMLLIFIGLKVAEFFLIILASVKASKGEYYKYPLTISFIK
jgi:uncharacterized Tic20 family protein